MELQRRLAAGRLSEVLGQETVELDRLFRTLGLYRAAEADVQVLGQESRLVLEAYAAGVNAYITSRPGRWSLEFNLLRHRPEPWRLADSLCWLKVMAWTTSCNWESELIRARLASRLGAEAAADLEPAYPAYNPAIVPGPGLPPGAEPPPNGWGSGVLREALRQIVGLLDTGPAPRQSEELPPGLAPQAGSSNQWVISGARSASGQPLLANDTHLALQAPVVWYQNHLCGGGYHVTGVSLPGMPGVAVGHNEHLAWGITIAWQDAQDLYIERFPPEHPHRYEYRGEWFGAEVRREEIRIKGRDEPEMLELVVTRHGPIISHLIGLETPLALRWVAVEPHDPMRSVLNLNRARGWDEFRGALGDWVTPSLNFVYADVRGNIGYVQAGRVPVRSSGFGLVPAPGWTGAQEWTGYLPLEEMPQAFNPETGWLATANHLVVDEAYPHFLSSDLENPCRARRVVDLITSRTGLTADDLARFQLDTYSLPAEQFTAHLLALAPEGERQRQALNYLRAWDARLEADSVAASIYQVCRLRALHLVFAGHLEDLASEYVGLGTTALGGAGPYHGRSIVRLLELLDGEGDERWLRDPETGAQRSREEVLSQALDEALDLLGKELGPEMARWTWGRLNRLYLAHPLGAVKPLKLLFNRGPYPLAGDQDTLLRASGRPSFPFGPAAVVDTLRFVADPGDWEQSRIVVPGGQSGHVASSHYADLLSLWRTGTFQPMPFDRSQVEHHAEAQLTLRP
jgi:penicillin amidase